MSFSQNTTPIRKLIAFLLLSKNRNAAHEITITASPDASKIMFISRILILITGSFASNIAGVALDYVISSNGLTAVPDIHGNLAEVIIYIRRYQSDKSDYGMITSSSSVPPSASLSSSSATVLILPSTTASTESTAPVVPSFISSLL